MKYTKADIGRLEGALSGAQLRGIRFDEASETHVETVIRLGLQQKVSIEKGYQSRSLQGAQHYRTHKPVMSEETAVRMERVAKKHERKAKTYEKLLRKIDKLGVPPHLVKSGVAK